MHRAWSEAISRSLRAHLGRTRRFYASQYFSESAPEVVDEGGDETSPSSTTDKWLFGHPVGVRRAG